MDHYMMGNAGGMMGGWGTMSMDSTFSAPSTNTQPPRRFSHKRGQHKRQGSQPEDIFNPNSNTDEVNTDGELSDEATATEQEALNAQDIEAAPRAHGHNHAHGRCNGCHGNQQNGHSHDDGHQHPQIEEPDNRQQRAGIQINITAKVQSGSMLPITMLLEKGYCEPRMMVDLATGATAMHYAAHKGHLKFLRWMVHKYPNDQELFNVKDKYGLNVAHYAARTGQLPCLMYAVEHMNVPADVPDNFNSTPLDLTIHYKQLYCFIYLYFSRGQRKINLSQLQDRAEILCQPQGAELEGHEKQKQEDTFRIVQILVRLDADGAYPNSLSKMFAPFLITQALANKRLDVVREVYDNCHYLPKLAQQERSQSLTAQNFALPDIMLKQMSEQVNLMPHLTADQKRQVNAIFDGHHWNAAKQAELEANSFGSHMNTIVRITLLMVFTFSLLVHVQKEPTDDFFSAAFSNPYATLGGNGKPSKWGHPIFHALLFVFLHMLMVGVTVAQLRLACLKPTAAKVMSRRYERGRGFDVLSQVMKLKDAQGRATTEQLPYIEGRFDDIDFDQLMIKSPMHDFCPPLLERVYEWHGYGFINPVMLTRENFRAYAWVQVLLQSYLFLVMLTTWLYQNVHVLQNSKGGVIGSLTELHLMSIINLFKTTENVSFGQKLSFFLVLAITESVYLALLKSTADTLFVIGHQMTLEELANPWKYAPQGRVGSLFNLSKIPVHLQGGKTSKSYAWRWQLGFRNIPFCDCIGNVFSYLVLCTPLKRDQLKQSSVSNERLWQFEQRLEKNGGVPKHAAPIKTSSQGDIELRQM